MASATRSPSHRGRRSPTAPSRSCGTCRATGTRVAWRPCSRCSWWWRWRSAADLGLALYATLSPLLVTATDGSSDTSAGVLILVALLVAQRSPIAGGALLAVAAAFKPYAVAWLPAAGIRRDRVAARRVPRGQRRGVGLGGPRVGASAHPRQPRAGGGGPCRPLLLAGMGRPGPVADARDHWSVLRYALGLLVAAIGWLEVRTARSFVVTGCAIFVVTLYAGWWSTFAYLAALAPRVLAPGRLAGAGRAAGPLARDPVGRLTAWVDERWPVRRPWMPIGDRAGWSAGAGER